MEKLLLRLPEAMEITGLGRTKIYELVQRGEIPSVKIGRSLRIPASALDQFVERLQAEQAENAEAIP